MTTHIPSHDHHDSRDPDDPGGGSDRPIRLSGPAGLLTSLPAMFGFVPEDSLVTVLLSGPGDRTVAAVARHDLADLRRGRDRLCDVAEQIGRVCDQESVTTVLALLIDSRWTAPEDPRWHRELVGDLDWLLDTVGVRIRDGLLCARIAAGQTWLGLADDRFGTLGDPKQTTMAAAHVYRGRALYDSRSEMAAVLSPDAMDPQVRAAVEQAAAGLGPEPGPPDRESDRAAVERICDLIAAEAQLSPPELADLVVDLHRPEVRDSLLALAIGPVAAHAERFWAETTRRLPAPWRAETAALFAFTAYARGEGPQAGIGVETALAARPGHRLAGLLSTALDAGMHPARIRELAEVGRSCADDLGARLP